MSHPESQFARLTMLVRQHLLALLVVAYICSAFLPGLGIRLREPITVSASVSMIYLLLAILLFTLGLSIPREKLPTAFLELKWVAVFVLLRLVACGLLLIACRLVQATNGIPALGIAVVLAAPTAASSAGWSMQWQAKESVTIALIVGSTLAVTATAPWAFSMGQALLPPAIGEHMASLAAGFRVGFVLPWVVLPVLAGIVVRSIVPATGKRLHRLGHAISPFVLLLLNYSNGSTSLPTISSATTPIRAVIVVCCCILVFLLLGLMMNALARWFGTDLPERKSLVIGVAMSNTGLGLMIATLSLPQAIEMHLAIITYTFVQHLGAALLDRFLFAPPAVAP